MEYIKPELLMMIPVLNIIGRILKSSAVGDKHIPAILTIISVILACIWVIGDGTGNLYNAMLGGIVQGVLCAGTAVYGNQIVKQYTKGDEDCVGNDRDNNRDNTEDSGVE